MITFLRESAQKYAQGVLIDIGCGTKPWKSIFVPHVSKYIGIDYANSLHGTSQVDIIADAYNTTIEENSCDTILCTEVLEHLEEPKKGMNEMNRILKEDGIVILTVPFFWSVHEAPRDFYRYSRYGLQYLFEEGGFEIIEIRPLTGFITTFSQLLIYFLLSFQKGLVLRTIGRLFNWGLQHVALWLNKYDKSFGFTNLYGVVARKTKKA